MTWEDLPEDDQQKQDPWAALPADPWAELPAETDPFIIKAVKTVVPPALRIGGAIAGGVAGAAIGNLPGVVAGGAAGAAGGEALAEQLEVALGIRKDINPVQIATQGALGAVPIIGRAGSVARQVVRGAGQGAVMGGASSVMTDLAEGQDISARRAAIAAGVGTALGAGGGRLAAGVRHRGVSAPNVGTSADVPTIRANIDPNYNQGVGDPELAGSVAYPRAQDGTPVMSDTPDLQGRTMMTGERLRDLLGVEPKEALARGWVVKEDNGTYRLIQNRPDLQRSLPQDTALVADQIPLKTTGGQAHGTGGPVVPDDLRNPAAIADKYATMGDKRPLMTREEISRLAKGAGEPLPDPKPIQPSERLSEDKMVARLPEYQRETAKAVLKEHAPALDEMRGGVQSHERTQALASWITAQATKNRPGTALNAEETLATANAAATINDKIDTLVQKVGTGQASPNDLVMLAKLRQDQTFVLMNYVSAGTEAARALEGRKIFSQVLNSNDIELMREALRRPEIAGADNFAKEWAALPDDLARLQYIRQHTKTTLWDKVTAVRYANMLSGVKTTFRNIGGFTVNAGYRTAAHPFAVAYDVGESLATGRERTIFMSELPARAVGVVTGLKQATDNALFTLREGIGPKAVETFDIPRPELGGGGKNPFNWVGRALEAQDQFNFTLARNSAVNGRLIAKFRAEGMKAGKRGVALDRYMDAKMPDAMLDPPADILAAAESEALHMLNRETAGSWTQLILNAKANPTFGKMLHFILPFTKIPASILRQGIENAPGGALLTQQGRAALNAGGRERAEVVGREALGAIALTSFAYWATQGKVSGNGPVNANDRATLMATGWRPNSVKIGNTWVDYSFLGQPLATAMFSIANLWENFVETKKVSSLDASRIAFAVANSALDQSFLTGVSDLNNALNDPQRYGNAYLGRMAQSAVPFAGAMRNVTQAIDPVVREPKGIKQSMQSIVPGLSPGVPPKIDILGNQATRPGSAVERAASPVNRSPMAADPVLKAIVALKLTLAPPPKTLPATRTQPVIELSTLERQRIGQVSREAARQLVESSAFQSLMRNDEELAASQLRQAMDRAREAAYRQIRTTKRPR